MGRTNLESICPTIFLFSHNYLSSWFFLCCTFCKPLVISFQVYEQFLASICWCRISPVFKYLPPITWTMRWLDSIHILQAILVDKARLSFSKSLKARPRISLGLHTFCHAMGFKPLLDLWPQKNFLLIAVSFLMRFLGNLKVSFGKHTMNSAHAWSWFIYLLDIKR